MIQKVFIRQFCLFVVGKRETEMFFYSLPVKTNHHPYWIKSGVVKKISLLFLVCCFMNRKD